jgi:hypothetical protein
VKAGATTSSRPKAATPADATRNQLIQNFDGREPGVIAASRCVVKVPIMAAECATTR